MGRPKLASGGSWKLERPAQGEVEQSRTHKARIDDMQNEGQAKKHPAKGACLTMRLGGIIATDEKSHQRQKCQEEDHPTRWHRHTHLIKRETVNLLAIGGLFIRLRGSSAHQLAYSSR